LDHVPYGYRHGYKHASDTQIIPYHLKLPNFEHLICILIILPIFNFFLNYQNMGHEVKHILGWSFTDNNTQRQENMGHEMPSLAIQ